MIHRSRTTTVAFGLLIGVLLLALAAPAAAQSGAITGRVSMASGAGIPNVTISAWDGGDNFFQAVTIANGDYTISGLPAGLYFVYTSNTAGFIEKVHRNDSFGGADCVGCDPTTTGTVVFNAGAGTTSGINFLLSLGGRISGSVYSTGIIVQSLAFMPIVVENETGTIVSRATTDAAGDYITNSGLPTGNYYVRTDGDTQYVNELYNNIPCPNGCFKTGAVQIAVTVPQAAPPSVVFFLSEGGRIAGKVSEADSVGADLSDNFSDNVIDPERYVAENTAGGASSLTESNGRLEFNRPGNLGGALTLRSTCEMNGDFDVQIDFNLSAWPANASTSFQLLVPEFSAAVSRRVSFGSHSYNFSVGRGSIGSASTSDTGGRLRLRRSGVVFEAFYWDGTTWQSLGSTSEVTDFPIPYTTLWLRLSGDVQQFAQFVTADNLTVTADGTSCGLPYVQMYAFKADGSFSTLINGDSAGHYITRALPTSTQYRVRTAIFDHVNEAYDDIVCQSCPNTTGDLISVSESAITYDIDFALESGGSISGTVTEAGNGLPLSALVYVYDSNGTNVDLQSTDASGNYQTVPLAAGNYFVRTSNSLGFVDELYSGIQCGPLCVPTSGTPVVVLNGAATDIDFALQAGGGIFGFVSQNGDGSGGVPVKIFDSTGTLFATVVSSSGSGIYSLFPLAPGTYYARTEQTGTNTLIDELYLDIICALCPATDGTPIAVVSDVFTQADFNLTRYGGRIAGQILSGATPLAGVLVTVFNGAGTAIATATSDASGNYQTPAMLPGSYYVKTTNTAGYIDEVYNNVTCIGCNPTTGLPVVILQFQNVGSINFNLAAGGRISGRVTDGGNAQALSGIVVDIYNTAGTLVTSVTSDAAGNYTTIGLPPATYYAKSANTIGFVDQVFDRRPCALNCLPTSGDALVLSAGVTRANVDFPLVAGARMSGRVTNAATSAGLQGVTVRVHNDSGALVAIATTDASGNYQLGPGLPGGLYYARTLNGINYIDELFSDVPCIGCQVTSGSAIAMTEGAITAGVNFALAAGGRILGRVRSSGLLPVDVDLVGVNVRLYDGAGNLIEIVTTGAGGNYSSTIGLPTGTYFGRTENTLSFIDQRYSGQQCLGGCVVTDGTPISVTSGVNTSNIDFALLSGGRIRGVVTNAGSTPLSGVGVQIYTSGGVLIGAQTTDAAGVYLTPFGLPSGSYFARTTNSLGYVDEAFNDVTCLECNVSATTPIPVTAPNLTNNINFQLALGGRVAGQVTNQNTLQAIAGVVVQVYASSGLIVANVTTDVAGNYITSGLPGGNYYAATQNTLGFIEEVFNNQRCLACSPLAVGTPIPVVVGVTAGGRNFALEPGGRLSGTVSDATLGGGISAVQVQVYDSLGTFVTSRVTDASGTYTTPALPPDTYFSRTSNAIGYTDHLYSAIPCNTSAVTSGTPIALTAGQNLATNYALRKPALTVQRNATQVTVTALGGRCVAQDSLQLYPIGGGGAAIETRYLNGQLVAPVTPVATGQATFNLSALTPGSYEVRFVLGGAATVLATTAPIVIAPAPTITLSSLSIVAGQTLTAAVLNAPGSTGDWIAMVPALPPGAPHLEWKYLGGAQTRPPTALLNAAVNFTMPNLPGTYVMKLFANDTTTVVATSAPFEIPVAGPAVTLSAINQLGGTDVNVTIANGPGLAGDWIGLFPATGSFPQFVAWKYLNNLQSLPAQGIANTTVSLRLPLTPGTYFVRLMRNNTNTVVTTSPIITVTGALPTITNPTTAEIDQVITATITNGPGTPADWIAVWAPGAGNYAGWTYLNGQKIQPAVALINGDVAVTMPDTPGPYNLRLLLNGSLQLLALGPTITVTGIVPLLTAAPGPVQANAPMTINLAGATKSVGDWVGLYNNTGAPDAAYVDWWYLDGTKTHPGIGRRRATFNVNAPSSTGTYQLRLFANDTFTRIISSAPITVTPPPSISLSATTVTAGAAFTATIANAPGTVADWVGLFPSGNPAVGSFTAWRYLNGLQTKPATPVLNGTVSFTAPPTPGTYVVRLYYNDGAQLRATSAVITVNAAAPTAGVSPGTVARGTSVTVTIANGPGLTGDWVGLFATGATNSQYVTWKYLNGLNTRPATGLANTSFSLLVPASVAPGTYQIRLFQNDTLTLVATSGTLTVTP